MYAINNPARTFDDYLILQMAIGHTATYVGIWNNALYPFSAAWFKKHPGGNPDLPTTPLAIGLQQKTKDLFVGDFK
jgi:hypothetical protein